MIGYVARRVGASLLLLLLLLTLVFLLLHAVPGSPLNALAGGQEERLSAEQRARLERVYGLDRPLGVQYLAWLVPWVVALGARPVLAFSAAGAAFLAAYYTSAAGEFPWFLANSLKRPAWNGAVLVLGLICWITVCWITVLFARRLASGAIQPAPADPRL